MLFFLSFLLRQRETPLRRCPLPVAGTRPTCYISGPFFGWVALSFQEFSIPMFLIHLVLRNTQPLWQPLRNLRERAWVATLSARTTQARPRSPHNRSIKRAQLGLALLTMIAVMGPESSKAFEEPHPFVAEDESFSLVLPNELIAHQRKTWFPIARFVTKIYTAQFDNEEFGINYTSLPRVIGWLSPKRTILNSARDGLLEDSNASLVAFRSFETREGPARSMVFAIPAQDGRPALTGQARMLIAKRRLYILWTETTPAISEDELQQFFASFRIGDWAPFAVDGTTVTPSGDGDPSADHTPAPQ